MKIFQLLCMCLLPGVLCSNQKFTKLEGESIFFGCAFNPPQGNKFFLKKGRSSENFLTDVSNSSTRSGRYSTGYENGIFYVSISQLKRSDSGHYRCGVGNASSPDLQRDFELSVTDEMCDGSTALNSPGVPLYSQAKGGSIRVKCSFTLAELYNLFFCKNKCKTQDVLVETSGFTAQSGRFGIEYEKKGMFHVTISNLSLSDSGLYSCGVNVFSAPNPCNAFEIRVKTVSDTAAGPSPGRDVTKDVRQGHPGHPDHPGHPGHPDHSFALIVCLTVFAVMSIFLLFFLCRKKINRLNITESFRSDYIECD
ncbi:polymeric immunoglobulin receptor-like [Melanotaenia boesemani]|uniref:polymeric immunoglobulin receptor-like n=1 Tax=Melanotaenia boesemani TaxID=1250792 RepID=UPI001C045887|nr:polymeric immunoglobulin receptor-like [Melanotaenia boesemani]